MIFINDKVTLPCKNCIVLPVCKSKINSSFKKMGFIKLHSILVLKLSYECCIIRDFLDVKISEDDGIMTVSRSRQDKLFKFMIPSFSKYEDH